MSQRQEILEAMRRKLARAALSMKEDGRTPDEIREALMPEHIDGDAYTDAIGAIVTSLAEKSISDLRRLVTGHRHHNNSTPELHP